MPCAGNQLCAFVKISSSSSSSSSNMPDAQVCQELLQHCRDRLVSAAVPSRMHCVPELPVSSAGKLQRSRLRALLTVYPDCSSRAEAAAAGASTQHGLQPGSSVGPADALGRSRALTNLELLPAASAVGPQSGSLDSEAAVAGLAWTRQVSASEAGVMRAFQASLGAHARGLEPVTNFWAAGGDSRAAMQVLAMPPPSLYALLAAHRRG